jgi:predicted nucleotidyltransferase
MKIVSANQTCFPALHDSRHPVHKIAGMLEPYLRVIVEKFHPDRIILFGSQAYGDPNENSDVDLLVVRSGMASENQSNLEIRQSFWSVAGSRPSFTILSKTPERIKQEVAAGSPFYGEILEKGLELYAAKTVER